MATKKYVSLDKLGLYDEKIKKVITDGDAAALQSAKDYADGLAVNYDAAGSAATAQSEAAKYTDAEIVKVNAAVAEAKGQADKGVADAATADGKAVKAQGDVDALKTYVGTIPEGATATDVVGYVQEKTAGIASQGAMTELSNRVGVVEGKVATIEGDYLKTADKTELAGDIADVQTAVDGEKTRAEGIEAGLRTDVDAIKGDYLKGADKTALQNGIDAVAGDVADIVADYLKGDDKTELEGKINAKAAQTALDAEIQRATQAEAGLQTQINTIMSNPDAEGAINSINEFTQYVTEHGTIADGMRVDINKNRDDIAAEAKRAGEAESALSGRLDTLEAIDHDAYKAPDAALSGRLDKLEAIDHDAYKGADTALKNELNGEIAKKADASALTSAVETLEGADDVLSGRLDVLEGKFTGEGSVEDMIGDAKQEAIDSAVGTAAADATQKANKALDDAKAYTNTEVGKDRTRLDALEAIEHHNHTNKAELDLIASGDKAKWDAAAAIAHSHENKTILDGLTAQNITTWNTVTSKAAQSDLTAVGDRVTAIETWHKDFVEVSEEEINAMFA